MKGAVRPIVAGVGLTVVALTLVLGVTLHREGLYALPGETIIVRFPAEVSTPAALQQVADAGASFGGSGPVTHSYRVQVLDAAAPRRLAEEAWILRDPLESLAQCLGFRSPAKEALRD